MIGRNCSARAAGSSTARTSPRALAITVVAALASSAPWATAGDYHSAGTLRCNDCHVMHFSQSHGYGPSGTGTWVRLGGLAPNRSLLRQQTNDLCLACHDGSLLATDVLGAANSGSQPGIVRLGGYLNRLGATGAPDTGHTLGSLDSAPGSSPAWSPQDENGLGRGLSCTNCHDPHGAPATAHPTGSQYRNLRDDPGNGNALWVTYNHSTPGSNNVSRDVFERAQLSYDESRVDWNEPNSQRSAIARWCGGCHTEMHGNWLGGSGGGGGHNSGGLPEHPVEDEDLETDMVLRYNSLVNRVKVTSEIGLWSPAGRDASPTCITCHKAHGNGNPRGLIFRSGTGILTENGDTGGTSQGNLCRQCHDSPNP